MMPDDLSFMQRALDLAASTTALASPNPQVGCVLVQDGHIIGEGAHLYEARDHAEIVALKQAAAHGHSVKGATAYVTLEPCSHFGRTGPCADALVAAGIGRCVVATGDPNPFVSGSGMPESRSRSAFSNSLPVTLTMRSRTLSRRERHLSPSKPPSRSMASSPRRLSSADLRRRTGSPAPPPAWKCSACAMHRMPS